MSMITSKIIKAVAASDRGIYTIAVAGGSASGKSWMSASLCEQLTKKGFEVVVLHQDDFALGKEFAQKETSPYRWDDPQNYRLDEALAVLLDFIDGKERHYLAYTLESHRPVVVSKLSWSTPEQSNGRRVVIIEGLFAWWRPFDILPDLRVFLDVNFFHRYVLRIYRNITLDTITTFEKVTSQYFSFVKRAHFELLEPLKATADIVVGNEIDVDQILLGVSTLPAGRLLTQRHDVYKDSSIAVACGYDGDRPIVEIAVKRGLIYREVVSGETLAFMRTEP